VQPQVGPKFGVQQSRIEQILQTQIKPKEKPEENFGQQKLWKTKIVDNFWPTANERQWKLWFHIQTNHLNYV